MDFHDFKVTTPMQSTGECPFVTQIGTWIGSETITKPDKQVR